MSEVKKSSSQQGTKEGYQRASFIVKTELVEYLKDVAWYDRKTIRDVMEAALVQYKEARGKVKSRPKDADE